MGDPRVFLSFHRPYYYYYSFKKILDKKLNAINLKNRKCH
ncbi:hypothetical protein GFS31_38420 [Leptolyngbya sp. BL0902]|nr:hypothetical protein GFS31_38420 [Leptolyngbya sp. BL0902]